MDDEISIDEKIEEIEKLIPDLRFIEDSIGGLATVMRKKFNEAKEILDPDLENIMAHTHKLETAGNFPISLYDMMVFYHQLAKSKIEDLKVEKQMRS